jgi:hypothetical protein
VNPSVVVTYTLKPESLDEHLQLIAGVFEELDRLQLTTVDYEVLRLEDGVSFIHIATPRTADGSNPLPGLPAFVAFTADLGSRVATPPSASPATVVATHSVSSSDCPCIGARDGSMTA